MNEGTTVDEELKNGSKRKNETFKVKDKKQIK